MYATNRGKMSSCIFYVLERIHLIHTLSRNTPHNNTHCIIKIETNRMRATCWLSEMFLEEKRRKPHNFSCISSFRANEFSSRLFFCFGSVIKANAVRVSTSLACSFSFILFASSPSTVVLVDTPLHASGSSRRRVYRASMRVCATWTLYTTECDQYH